MSPQPCKRCSAPASQIAPRTSINFQGPGQAGLWAFLCDRCITHLKVVS